MFAARKISEVQRDVDKLCACIIGWSHNHLGVGLLQAVYHFQLNKKQPCLSRTGLSLNHTLGGFCSQLPDQPDDPQYDQSQDANWDQPHEGHAEETHPVAVSHHRHVHSITVPASHHYAAPSITAGEDHRSKKRRKELEYDDRDQNTDHPFCCFRHCFISFLSLLPQDETHLNCL